MNSWFIVGVSYSMVSYLVSVLVVVVVFWMWMMCCLGVEVSVLVVIFVGVLVLGDKVVVMLKLFVLFCCVILLSVVWCRF